MQDITIHLTKYSDRKCYTAWYRDPVTERRVTKSTKATGKLDAMKFAVKWENELRSGQSVADPRITWEDFRKRFEQKKLPALAKKTASAYATAFNHLERIILPKRLASLTTMVLTDFAAKLREDVESEDTVATYLRHVKVALRWAEDEGLMKAPKITMPKRAKGKRMRGRPITTEEFERMLDAVHHERPDDVDAWKRYLRGLWYSGLRLSESLDLSWELDANFTIDLSGKRPKFCIFAEAQKPDRDELLPMTPDFARFIRETPESERQGYVFDLTTRASRGNADPKRVYGIVRAISERARVIVERRGANKKIKYATPHDLRRSFGTRWATRVMPAVLKRLMRHRDIATTMSYYVDIQADDIADELWRLEAKNQQIDQQSGVQVDSSQNATERVRDVT